MARGINVIIGKVLMHKLAGAERLVAVVPHVVHQCLGILQDRIYTEPALRRVVPIFKSKNPRCVRVDPCNERGTARPADRGIAVRVHEADALCGEGVDVWRLCLRMTAEGPLEVVQVVTDNEEHVHAPGNLGKEQLAGYQGGDKGKEGQEGFQAHGKLIFSLLANTGQGIWAVAPI